MSTTVAIILAFNLLIGTAIATWKYHKSKDSHVRRPNFPFYNGIFIGPLPYFLMIIGQRKERKKFMQGKRRYS
jgi:hypothetical protein